MLQEKEKQGVDVEVLVVDEAEIIFAGMES
jgi:hypothetical protein